MNLAFRDIRHHSGRFALTGIGLSLLLGVVLSMIGIYRGLVDDALALVRSPAADLWVVEGGTHGPFAESSRIPRDTRDGIARLAGIASAGVVTYQSVQVEVDQRPLRLFVVGYELGRPGGPARLADGRPLERSHFELVVDRRTGIPLGSRLRLGQDTFTVVGRTAGHVDSGGNPIAYMTLKDAQKLQFTLEGAAARNQAARGESANRQQVNAVVATMLPGQDAAEAAHSIRRWKHLTAMTQQEQEDLLLTAVVEKARRQIGLFTAVLLVVSTVIIALIIYTMTMDKMREIATLKLIGAPNRTIVGLILQQALALGGVGFALGSTLIIAAAEHFPRRVLVLPADVIALGAVVLVICIAASLFGVRYALRVDPARALGG